MTSNFLTYEACFQTLMNQPAQLLISQWDIPFMEWSWHSFGLEKTQDEPISLCHHDGCRCPGAK